MTPLTTLAPLGPLLILLTLTTLLFASTTAEEALEWSTLSASDLHALCLQSPLCRNAYQQEHGELSLQHFQHLAHGALQQRPNQADLLTAYLTLHHVVFSESRCPPNTYWRWNKQTHAGVCTCYLDRDCRIAAMPLCYDSIHPILLLCFVLVAVLVLGFIITTNCCQPEHDTSDHGRR